MSNRYVQWCISVYGRYIILAIIANFYTVCIVESSDCSMHYAFVLSFTSSDDYACSSNDACLLQRLLERKQAPFYALCICSLIHFL